MRAAEIKKSILGMIDLMPLGLRLKVRHLPGIAQVQRALFRYLTRESGTSTYTITAGPAKGLRLALKLPEEKGFWMGTHELPVTTLLSEECRPGDVCWDVGSHIGYVACVLSRKSEKITYCFEPFDENRRRIQNQARLNPDVRLEILECALGEKCGSAEFTLMPDASMGKLSDSSFQKDKTGAKKIKVPMSTIDEIVSSGKARPPDLIKIDTEGAEYLVLRGGEKTLAARKPRLLLEVHGCEDDAKLWELLKRHHYRCTVVETGLLAETLPEPGRHLWCVSQSKVK